MDAAQVMLGFPELIRMARGDTITIRLRPGTTRLTIRLSALAQSEILKRSQKSSDPIGDLIDELTADVCNRIRRK